MRFAVIENGRVVNVAEADSEPPQNWVQSDTANIGDEYDGFLFTNPSAVKNKIAERRYKAEIAGINLQGLEVKTDDRSKLLINGAALEAVIDPAYVMQWKTTDGFVELGGKQVIGVAQAVRAHVQACFDREAELLDILSDGKYTDDLLEQGWP